MQRRIGPPQEIRGPPLCAVQKGTDTTAFTNCASAPASWRPRSFVYDSLSHLTSATNPESGNITYSYDANGNLATEVVPKAGQTGTLQTTHNYTYDVLNRLIQHAHVDPSSGTEKYAYDGTTLTGCPGPSAPGITSPTNLIGRRSAMCTTMSSSSWSYDAMGRPLIEARSNKGSSLAKTYNVGYGYYKDGSLNTLTYPSGDVLTDTVGGAGRVTQVSDSSNNYVGYTGTPANYATYTPNGALAGMTNSHTATFEGIVTSNIYNNLLQPILLSASVSSSPIFSLCYDFHLHLALSSPPCTFSAYTTGDNGNVFRILNNVDSTRNAVFAYDPLNRIKQANTVATSGANCWGEAYTIDAWGNLTNRAGVSGMTGCSTEPLNTPASAKNQLSGISYDAAGNVTNDGIGNQPTYDAENRIATDAGFTYSYDADGVRMEKAAGTSGTMYWPGPSGEHLTETDLTGTINEEYIYFNGARIARVDRPSGTVHYYFSDHLGSASVITDASGGVQQRYFYYPYGGMQSSIGSDPNHYKFTGKERDTESGLDEFGARYYGSSLGRFMTPDWAAAPTAVPYAHYGNPQSLNLYSYVQNNPTTVGDPDGHGAMDASSYATGDGFMTFGIPSSIMQYQLQAALTSPPPQQQAQNQQMSLSSQGLDFIKKYEKLRLKAYKDQAGYETIGYGHKVLPGEDFSKGITKAQALELLKNDVQGAVNAVNGGLKVSVRQNQFDALVSLAFNAGGASVRASNQMMRAVNAGHVTEENFTAYRWVHVNGEAVVSQGLLRRREDEYLMYSEGKY